MRALGATQQLSATVTDKAGKTLTDAIVSWASGNKSVATVDTNGTVTAVGVGSGTVTATAGGVSGTATITVDPSNNLAKAAGDNQYGYQGTKLAIPVAVRVRDAQGNGVPGHLVQFATAAGNGTVDSAVAFTDSAGVARTGWVMPPVTGTTDTVLLQATALDGAGAPLLGSPATFTAIAHTVLVSGVTPSPLSEGQSATISGSGFDAGAPSVTIDGKSATVTAASATQLTVTVPAYDCKPPRPVAVQVNVGSIPAAPITAAITAPKAPLTLAVGQQAIVSDSAAFCFQFATTTAAETYLVGVASSSDIVTDLQPITLVGSAADTTAVLLPAPAFEAERAGVTPVAPIPSGRLARWLRWGQAEVRRRQLDRPLFEQARGARYAAPLGARTAQLVSDTLQAGDTVVVNFPGDSCRPGDSVQAEVRSMGQHAIWLEDIHNPATYPESTITRLSQLYDATIYPTDTLEFGTPTDADGNGRVVIVITREVNKLGGGELGFVTSCDLLPPGPPYASNAGEFTYILSPDPNGIWGFTYSVASAARDLPEVTAHESVHIIQFTRRDAASHPFPDSWWAEGQAVLGQEVVGDVIEGHTPRTNSLGVAQATNLDDTTSTDFYGLGFSALGLYFGWDPVTTPGVSAHIATAPWECSWLDVPPFNPEPCVGGLDLYGGPWLLLRYLSDRFNATLTEAGLQHALIDNALTGYALFSSVTGVPMDSLLAQFAAMMYVDDLPGVTSPDPALTEASWNLYNVFYGTYSTGGHTYGLRSQLRLTPDSVAFANFTRTANVRAASSYYALLSGPGRPAFALKARNGAGGVLPGKMRYWIVRLH